MVAPAFRLSRTTRSNEILNLLVKHDIWGMIRQMQRGTVRPGETPPEARMRELLEDLGPTFIKLGQLLATRPDLVPAAFSEEFKNLYDGTEPTPFPEVEAVLADAFGKPWHEVFSEFGRTALASASVGQVHVARLKDGTKVAVKIQHPNIAERVEVDFQILAGILTFIEKTFAASRIWQPSQHLEELRQMMDRELDYRVEVTNTKKVAHNFRHEHKVHVPHMYGELCSERVIVMEFIDGISFSDPNVLEAQGIDRRQIARTVTQAMAKQIFVDRIFHADPSPGNLKALPDNRVAFLDFGAVGVVTERRAKAIFRLIHGMSKSDVTETGEAIVDLCDQLGEFDPKKYEADIEKILDFFERETISVADPRVMERILNIATDHKLVLPPDFLLINRAMFQFDGFCRDLDPDYDLVEVLEPLVGEIVWKNLTNTRKQREMIEEVMTEFLRFGRHAPRAMNRVLKRVERNELRTTIDLAGMDGMKKTFGRGMLKLSFSIIIAAFIMGAGWVYGSEQADDRVGQYMFLAGALIIAWTLVMVLWSEGFRGRREFE